MNGLTGKILHVDLSTRTWHAETLPESVYAGVLGGVGLGAYILNRDLPAGADPLGPDAILGVVAGVLVGTGAMFTGRWMAVGKSPLTGGWGDANCGGNLAPAIKQCGYDGIFIRGGSETPVYLFADGEKVEICDAAAYWGMDTIETEAALIEAHGKKARVASIGPAGERLALIAGIANDRGRLAARSGLGAVMGSKKLKAVVLAGSKPVKAARPEDLRALSKQVVAEMPKAGLKMPGWFLPILGRFMLMGKTSFRTDGLMVMGPMRKWGTAAGNEISLVAGDAPVRNWRGLPRQFRGRAVNADRLVKNEKKKYHCYACPLGCGGIVDLGPHKTHAAHNWSETHRPEYETTTAFGSLVGNENLDSIFYLNELANRAGLDSISTGAVIAFAIDLFEHGILTEAETQGLRLTWGNTPAICQLAVQIIDRQGLGDLLADGVARAAARIGGEAHKYAIHAGGQELPMHDPRYDPSMGVFYVSDATPGRHTVGSTISYETYRPWTRIESAPETPSRYPKASIYQATEANARQHAAGGMLKMVLDACGYCTFGAQLGVDRLKLFESLNAASGWDKTPDEYLEIGRRIASLRQGFNVRHGVEPGSVQTNPLVYGDPPPTGGPLKGRHFDLYAMRRLYWQAMGWDPEDGHPPAEMMAVPEHES